MIFIGYSKNKDKRNWLSTATKISTEIIGCTEVNGVDQDGVQEKRWIMSIKMTPGQLTVNPNSTYAWVYIKELQYRKYISRNSVEIYHSREDPFVFLLEDEI